MTRTLDDLLDLLANGDSGGLSPSAHHNLPPRAAVALGYARATATPGLQGLEHVAHLAADLDVYASSTRPGTLVIEVPEGRCLGSRGDVTFDANWGAVIDTSLKPAALALLTPEGVRLVAIDGRRVTAYAWTDEPSALDALEGWRPPAPPQDPGLPEPHTLAPDATLPPWMLEAVARLRAGDVVDGIAALGLMARLEPPRPTADALARLLAGDFGASDRLRALARSLPDTWVSACVDLAISRAALLGDGIEALASVDPEQSLEAAATLVRAREDLACAWTALFATGRASAFGRALDDLDALAEQSASAFPPLPLLATDERLTAAQRAAISGWWIEWLT